jgi:hypothetical protein
VFRTDALEYVLVLLPVKAAQGVPTEDITPNLLPTSIYAWFPAHVTSCLEARFYLDEVSSFGGEHYTTAETPEDAKRCAEECAAKYSCDCWVLDQRTGTKHVVKARWINSRRKYVNVELQCGQADVKPVSGNSGFAGK